MGMTKKKWRDLRKQGSKKFKEGAPKGSGTVAGSVVTSKSTPHIVHLTNKSVKKQIAKREAKKLNAVIPFDMLKDPHFHRTPSAHQEGNEALTKADWYGKQSTTPVHYDNEKPGSDGIRVTGNRGTRWISKSKYSNIPIELKSARAHEHAMKHRKSE